MVSVDSAPATPFVSFHPNGDALVAGFDTRTRLPKLGASVGSGKTLWLSASTQSVFPSSSPDTASIRICHQCLPSSWLIPSSQARRRSPLAVFW